MIGGTLETINLDGKSISGTGSRNYTLEYTIPIYKIYGQETEAMLMNISFNQATSVNRGNATISTDLFNDVDETIINYSGSGGYSENIVFNILGNSSVKGTNNIRLYTYGRIINSEFHCVSTIKDIKLTYLIYG